MLAYKEMILCGRCASRLELCARGQDSVVMRRGPNARLQFATVVDLFTLLCSYKTQQERVRAADPSLDDGSCIVPLGWAQCARRLAGCFSHPVSAKFFFCGMRDLHSIEGPARNIWALPIW